MSPLSITIFSATGNQGQSLINALSEDGREKYAIRALTRSPTSSSSKALVSRGIEVVETPKYDTASIAETIKGTDILFVVTIPTEFGAPVPEAEQGGKIIAGAKQAGVKYIIFSGLPSYSKFSHGKYKNAKHFEEKAEIEEILRASGVPHTIVHTGFFAENLQVPAWGMFRKSNDGASYKISIPKFSPQSPQTITWIAKDLGKAVLAIIEAYETTPHKVVGKTFIAATARMTYPELGEILAKELCKPITFESTETSGMAELDESFQHQNEFGYFPHSTPIPDPALVELGFEPANLSDFAKELKED